MAISEACQVWIEQRINEELEVQSHTGKSLRAIGKDIAKEIEKVFEAKVNPGTVFQRVRRIADTNVSCKPTNEYDNEIMKNQEPRKHIATGNKPAGGTREGAGRKLKYGNEVSEDEERLVRAYNAFLREVSAAKTNQWKEVSKKRINDLISNLIILVEA